MPTKSHSHSNRSTFLIWTSSRDRAVEENNPVSAVRIDRRPICVVLKFRPIDPALRFLVFAASISNLDKTGPASKPVRLHRRIKRAANARRNMHMATGTGK